MTLRLSLALFASLLLVGCDDQSMTRQNRYRVYAPAALFANGAEAQPPPMGTVAQGDLDRAREASTPPHVDMPLLQRGRERYDINCSPCHGLAGKGDGMIVQRGFPRPPSYHSARLLAAPAQHFVDVITSGYGVMYSYAARVEPRDRWAIAAYIRALQELQRTKLAEAPHLGSKLP